MKYLILTSSLMMFAGIAYGNPTDMLDNLLGAHTGLSGYTQQKYLLSPKREYASCSLISIKRIEEKYSVCFEENCFPLVTENYIQGPEDGSGKIQEEKVNASSYFGRSKFKSFSKNYILPGPWNDDGQRQIGMGSAITITIKSRDNELTEVKVDRDLISSDNLLSHLGVVSDSYAAAWDGEIIKCMKE